MKPPLPHSESAVPRTPHAQLEIAKAMRTLMAPDEDELLRRRRAEIAAIRGELEALARDIPMAFAEASALVQAELRRRALAKTYNPDQPRVPAGNRDGGRWTSGGNTESEALSDQSVRGVGDTHEPRIRYAQASTDTATDAASSGSDTRITTLPDTQHDLSNAGRALVSAAHSLLGTGFHDIVGADNSLGRFLRTFLDPNYFDIHRIGADEVPVDHPRAPVPFLDSNNEQIYAGGTPLLRPIGLPPELYAQAGFVASATAAALNERINMGWPTGRGVDTEAEMVVTSALMSKLLAALAPGGVLDSERFDWTYVRDYRRYQNIMIGVFAAAAGMRVEDMLSLVDAYAAPISRFKDDRDSVYTHSAKQDVEDTKRGYALYQSGRIRLTK